jgi:hypothetical protein
LRTVYQRAHFNGKPGATNITGFGLLHDGTGFELPRGHFYVLDNLETLQELDDVTAFLLCFDTGTAPTVGFSRTLVQSTAGDTTVAMALDTLEAQAAAAACDAIARGRVTGQWRQWAYDPVSRRYRDGTTTLDGATRAELLSRLGPDDALTFMGVPPGQGIRLGADRDQDTVADGIEPLPSLEIGRSTSGLQLAWPESFRDWTIESAVPGEPPWRGTHAPPVLHDGKWRLAVPGNDGNRWFRLKRTW